MKLRRTPGDFHPPHRFATDTGDDSRLASSRPGSGFDVPVLLDGAIAKNLWDPLMPPKLHDRLVDFLRRRVDHQGWQIRQIRALCLFNHDDAAENRSNRAVDALKQVGKRIGQEFEKVRARRTDWSGWQT